VCPVLRLYPSLRSILGLTGGRLCAREDKAGGARRRVQRADPGERGDRRRRGPRGLPHRPELLGESASVRLRDLCMRVENQDLRILACVLRL
jgi:hypothetical protein